MKKMMKIVCASVWALVFLLAVICQAESKYAAGVTAAGVRVNLGSQPGEWGITAISAIAGADDETVDVYVRTGSKVIPTAGGTTNMQCVNTGGAITNSDVVIGEHSDGTLQYLTVAAASTTNIAFTAALSPAWTNGFTIFELAQVAAFPVGQTNARGDKASTTLTGSPLVRVPADSPASVFMNSATNNYLTVTR